MAPYMVQVEWRLLEPYLVGKDSVSQSILVPIMSTEGKPYPPPMVEQQADGHPFHFKF